MDPLREPERAPSSPLQGYSFVFKLLITLVSLLCAQFFIKTRITRTARLLNKFPGGPVFPIIGNGAVLFGNPRGIQKRFTSYLKKYGKTVRLWKLYQPRIFTTEPKFIEIVLSSPHCIEKGDDYNCIRYFLGNGLLTSPGKIWKKDRKTLNPGLNYQRFDGFLDIFNKQASTLVEILGETFRNNNFNAQNLHPILGRCTMDIIIQSTLGNDLNIQYEQDKEFIQALYTSTDAIKTILFKPWLTFPVIRTLFGNYTAEVKAKQFIRRINIQITEERRSFVTQNLEGVAARTKPLLDILLESETGKDNEALNDQINTIIGAGTDTTSTTMNFTLFLLALNPECQAKVHEEIDQLFQNDLDRPLTFSDISELNYLEMCVKESMRLLPPIPMFARKAQQDIKLDDDGLVIPKGCDVYINVFDVHHDPDFYPKPYEFNPERFNKTEKTVKINSYNYLPFSAGSRNCIGRKYAMKEMIVLLAHILRKFQVETLQRLEDLEIVYGIPLEVHPHIQLSLKLR